METQARHKVRVPHFPMWQWTGQGSLLSEQDQAPWNKKKMWKRLIGKCVARAYLIRNHRKDLMQVAFFYSYLFSVRKPFLGSSLLDPFKSVLCSPFFCSYISLFSLYLDANIILTSRHSVYQASLTGLHREYIYSWQQQQQQQQQRQQQRTTSLSNLQQQRLKSLSLNCPIRQCCSSYS